MKIKRKKCNKKNNLEKYQSGFGYKKYSENRTSMEHNYLKNKQTNKNR